jgi:asparagine synthase (glutamine-hydrolysing)
MCGLAGIARLDGAPVDPRALARMSDALWHRGPDDAGTYIEGNVGLAHRRLSILDLSPAGHQPMSSVDGTIWIVFNGEIYNYVELREELRHRGHTFRTGTDTEVIIHLYQEMGEACLEKLQGMFGIVIWDSRRRALFAARDRVGIKPVYFAHTSTALVLASEIKALLASGEVGRNIDPRGIADHLFCGYPLGDKTPFQGVRQLQPGEALRLENGRLHIWKYWDVQYRYDRGRSFADTVVELREHLDRVVREHCRSDAAVGCHLSGGLDSSTVSSIASRHLEPLHTFSIRFSEGGPFDESAYARVVADSIGSRHFEQRPGSADLGALLPFLAWHMDVPMTKSAFSYFSSSHLAHEHVKVALTGHGGDEVFAGYRAQFDVGLGDTSMFESTLVTLAQPTRTTRLKRLLRTEGMRGLTSRVTKRLLRRPLTHEERWVSQHCGLPPGTHYSIHSRFRTQLAGYDPTSEYLESFRNAPTDELLDRCLYHDLRCYLPGLLHAEDRVSMSLSLESRVPLLDHTLIEFLATVPPSAKVPSRVPKELLREAMTGVLPEQIRKRRNKGAFFVPASRWLTTSLSASVRDLLLAPRSLDRGIFDPAWLRHAVEQREDVWDAVSVELWCRLHLDEDPEMRVRAEQTGAAVRNTGMHRPTSVAV